MIAQIQSFRRSAAAITALVVIIAPAHPAQASLTPARQAKATAALLGLWINLEYGGLISETVTVAQISDALDQGANVNAKGGPFGVTALNCAAVCGEVDCVTFLISKGADVNPKGFDYTPLMVAILSRHTDCAEFLVSMGADVNALGLNGTALMFAASAGRLDYVKLLVAKGTDVNAHVKGLTALKLAVGHPAVIAALKAAGAKE